MIEESYVRLYAADFTRLAQRAETQPLGDLLTKRMKEARSHALVMDARKGSGHLAALITRLRDEARRPTSPNRVAAADPTDVDRRPAFLNTVADSLSEPA